MHIDHAMTNISIGVQPAGFAVVQLKNIVNVAKESDKYFKFDAGDWLRISAGLIPNGGVGPFVDYKLSTGSYLCERYGAVTQVTDVDRENADEPLQPDIDATDFVTVQALLKAESIVQTVVFTATSWAAANRRTLAGAEQWNDFAGSTPIDDIQTGIQAIEPKIAKPGEECTVIMGRDVFNSLKTHPDIKDFMSSNERKLVTEEVLAQAFGVKKVIAPSSAYNSAAEGVTDSFSYIWSDTVWLGYLPENPSLKTPAAFYIMSHNPSGLPSPQGQIMTFIERTRQDRTNGHLENRDLFRGSVYMTCEVTSDVAGYIISDVLA
jgi:hypothetical protein